jgi:hypothetical protein
MQIEQKKEEELIKKIQEGKIDIRSRLVQDYELPDKKEDFTKNDWIIYTFKNHEKIEESTRMEDSSTYLKEEQIFKLNDEKASKYESNQKGLP